ncbi:MAG: hypothetical protein COA86_02055 [Kangiella sp.]|nr:MAG: hypothetical protein COA86_02055 [Kangiella sp.]
MCTLTYRLNENGYELFFNRDEQHSRSKALPPKYQHQLKSIYPIDVSAEITPNKNGTWIAVDQYGTSLALLNNYPLESNEPFIFNRHYNFSSRGDIILSLLKLQTKENKTLEIDSIFQHLNQSHLTNYKPFKLIVLSNQLTQASGNIYALNWNGKNIEVQTIGIKDLPVTSSSINIKKVHLVRQKTFNTMCSNSLPSSAQLKAYHFSTETDNSMSVNMFRVDARTVSISHISVSDEIKFEYFDNLDNRSTMETVKRVND